MYSPHVPVCTRKPKTAVLPEEIWQVVKLYVEGHGGVARGKKFSLCHPQATHESVHKKCQPIRSSRLAGQREHIYEFLVLLYRL